MAGMRDSPMDGVHDEHEAVINRLNLSLARSQSILNSWLPRKSETEHEDETVDTDPDFAPSREHGGIGARNVEDDGSALPTRRSTQKDRLLEQLLGKKAANAKRKEDARKSMSASKHAAPKPVMNDVKQSKRQEESDEEEGGGRAAAFKSKRSKVTDPAREPAEEISDARERDAEMQESHISPRTEVQAEPAKDRESLVPEAQLQKRKGGGSYLDELLSKKAKKKSKTKPKA